MKSFKLDDMIGGWFIGNFVPTSLKVEGFEVGLKRHTKDEYIEPHFHKIATEYNLVVKGKVVVQGKLYEANDIFVLEPNDVADPVFLEDSDIVVVKVPSVIGDKYTT